MQKALCLFRIYWFFWFNYYGHDNNRVCIDDLPSTNIYESNYESGFDILSLIFATNDYFEQHSSVLCQWILWKSHHFPVSFFIFLLPFFSCGLDWFSEGCLLGTSLSYFGCCGFADPNWVILFLDRIHKKIPSGLDPIYSKLLCGTFLLVKFPPMFDMGEILKECEGDHFPFEEIMNREITF
jgi:hypothetical protein